jgi:hypothetical protein
MVTEVAENVYWKNQKAAESPTEAKFCVPIKVVEVESSCPPNAKANPILSPSGKNNVLHLICENTFAKCQT